MDSRARAEQLLTSSSAARRIADLVAAAGEPVRYEVLRHLLRVSEETMTEALQEAVDLRLVRRAEDAFTYVTFDEATGTEIVEAMGPERAARMRGQMARARQRVFE